MENLPGPHITELVRASKTPGTQRWEALNVRTVWLSICHSSSQRIGPCPMDRKTRISEFNWHVPRTYIVENLMFKEPAGSCLTLHSSMPALFPAPFNTLWLCFIFQSFLKTSFLRLSKLVYAFLVNPYKSGPFKKLAFIILYVCVRALPACLSVHHMRAWCP